MNQRPKLPATGDTSTGRWVGEVEVQPGWTVAGALPLGMAASLVLAVLGRGRGRRSVLDLVGTGRIGPGPCRLSVELDADGQPRGRATLESADGEARIDATLRADTGPTVVKRPSPEPPALYPDDVLPFRGRQPGPMSAYEVRPLPISGTDRHADAWVRPLGPEASGIRHHLVALDAWLTPDQLDFAVANAARLDGLTVPVADVRRARLLLPSGSGPLLPKDCWLRRRLRSATHGSSTIETGSVELLVGDRLRTELLFVVERDLIAADGSKICN